MSAPLPLKHQKGRPVRFRGTGGRSCTARLGSVAECLLLGRRPTSAPGAQPRSSMAQLGGVPLGRFPSPNSGSRRPRFDIARAEAERQRPGRRLREADATAQTDLDVRRLCHPLAALRRSNPSSLRLPGNFDSEWPSNFAGPFARWGIGFCLLQNVQVHDVAEKARIRQ